ncbi:MAG: Hpt domain-containing protein [Gammaproteobacteria bacterium]|nr:MAG: Hpt domain-containing protein [Gammaproteobacteria bacterium]
MSSEVPEERDLSTVLDSEALDTIKSLEQPGMPSLLERVINTYLETAEPIVEQLKDRFAANDADGVMHASHSLKSSSANVGAKRLSGMCAEIESYSREGIEALSGLDERITKIAEEFVIVKQALHSELKK